MILSSVFLYETEFSCNLSFGRTIFTAIYEHVYKWFLQGFVVITWWISIHYASKVSINMTMTINMNFMYELCVQKIANKQQSNNNKIMWDSNTWTLFRRIRVFQVFFFVCAWWTSHHQYLIQNLYRSIICYCRTQYSPVKIALNNYQTI